jgi:hypothetical protein
LNQYFEEESDQEIFTLSGKDDAIISIEIEAHLGEAHRQHNWQRQQHIGIYSTQLKRLHMQAQYGTRQTGKRLATLKKCKNEQQDSFSTITQTEHLAVLLKW